MVESDDAAEASLSVELQLAQSVFETWRTETGISCYIQKQILRDKKCLCPSSGQPTGQRDPSVSTHEASKRQ